MLKSILKSVAVASVLAASVGSASAATVSLKFTGGTANGSVTFGATPIPDTVGDTVGAYGFNMKDVTAGGVLGSFIAWCLDIEHNLGTSDANAYNITSTPFSNSYGLSETEMSRVQKVFDANYSGVVVGNADQAAGFQVALWNALYDGDQSATTGLFYVNASDGIISAANAYLEAAFSYSGSSAYSLTFLESKSGKQNLVTATPVPVPAAMGLMLLALGGLAAVGRRSRTA